MHACVGLERFDCIAILYYRYVTSSYSNKEDDFFVLVSLPFQATVTSVVFP